jgi:predicted nucleic acid-binding protein
LSGVRASLNVSRLLKGRLMIDIDKPMSRQAGALCTAAGTSDVVDALVVVIALRYRAAVVTSDPGDIGRLATSSGHDVPIRPTRY